MLSIRPIYRCCLPRANHPLAHEQGAARVPDIRGMLRAHMEREPSVRSREDRLSAMATHRLLNDQGTKAKRRSGRERNRQRRAKAGLLLIRRTDNGYGQYLAAVSIGRIRSRSNSTRGKRRKTRHRLHGAGVVGITQIRITSRPMIRRGKAGVFYFLPRLDRRQPGN